MSLQIVIDMNLSPEWVVELAGHGWSAVHWSTVGNPRATDATIMAWAVANRYVVLTHDLDFGTALALTHAAGPSVVQVRGQNVLPEHMACRGDCVASTRTRSSCGGIGSRRGEKMSRPRAPAIDSSSRKLTIYEVS